MVLTMNTKQVIILRTKYFDENGKQITLRKGKFVSQGSHGSMCFLVDLIKNNKQLTKEQLEWINNDFTKICLQVDTEKELLEIYHQAKENNLTTYLIVDNGRTEFNNVPTNTCVCIGPHENKKIDKITGNLKLL